MVQVSNLFLPLNPSVYAQRPKVRKTQRYEADLSKFTSFNWINIENEFLNIHNYLYDRYGPLDEYNYHRIYQRWVVPYFSTYDQHVGPYCNGDRQYAPVLFCWYAKEVLQCPDRYPIRIMRAICLDYLNTPSR